MTDFDGSDGSGGSVGEVRALAVTTGDVVTALEANERRGRDAVLRVTPPFTGRMRARLHLAGAEGAYEGPSRPVHIDPERLVRDPPAFPSVDETGDELRASEEAYSRERHRERHEAAVAEWRAAVRDALVERATISTGDGRREVDVSYLG